MKLSEGIRVYLEFQRATVAPKSLEAATDQLNYFLRFTGDVSLDEIGPEHINRFTQSMLDRSLSGYTIQCRTARVRFFFSFCIARNFAKASPFENMKLLIRVPKRKTRRVPFTEAHYRMILTRCREIGERYSFFYHACQIAWETGLRLGDVSTLEWAMVDFEQEFIRLAPRKTRRYYPQLEIPMTPELVDMLLPLRAEAEEDEKYVMPRMAYDYKGSPSRLLSTVFRTKILIPIGLTQGYSFHCFRHSFVTRMLEAGITPEVIGSITGQTVAQVMAYGTITKAAKRNAMMQMRAALHQAQMERLGINPPPFVPNIRP